MVTTEKLAANLDLLRNQMPKKPKKYTSDHPVTLFEALTKYSNSRSVNGVQSCTFSLNEHHWPLPLWIDHSNIHFGFFNKLYYKRFYNSFRPPHKFEGLKDFEYLWIPVINEIAYKKKYDDTLTEAFDVNLKYIKRKLLLNSLLSSKESIIQEIFKSYKKKYWIACINTLFPLLDFVTRTILNTKNLTTDIGKICKVFKQNGFDIDTANHLMPHITLVNSLIDPARKLEKTEHDKLYEKIKNNQFGLIGPALCSFLFFANHYYGYYKEDVQDKNVINRHGILHGSIDSFGNKANAVKLFTFLYLLLELEPVFKILLQE